MNVFLAGGSKSGKSMLAQRIARAMCPGAPRYYLATMIPHDAEDDARIARHRQERAGWGFETVECGVNILAALEKTDPAGVFLLDSVTALLSNEMFRADGTMDEDAGARLARELTELAEKTGNCVFVCDNIFADAGAYGEWTERYRQALGALGAALCRVCEAAGEVCCGVPVWHKGGWAE